MPLTIHDEKPDFYNPDGMFNPAQTIPELLAIHNPKSYKLLAPAMEASLTYWSKSKGERAKATEPTPPKGQEEALAIEAFAWFIEFLEKANFRYVYGNVVPLLYHDEDMSALAGYARTKRLELNCRGCAGSLLQILRFLGFPENALKLHVSNTQSVPTVKIVQRQSGTITAGNVRSVAGPKGDAAWPYITNPPAQKDIGRTNGLVITRSAPPNEKKELGTILVEKSNRDPFLNHYVAMVDVSAVKFKYFDVLTGCRYKNGQDDFFEAFTKKQLKVGGKTWEWYQSDEEEHRRIYEVKGLPEITNNPVFKALDKRWKDDGVDDIVFWWIVDPDNFEDPYFDEFEDDKKNPDEHPPLVCHLYGITQPFSVADMKQQWDAAKATFEKVTGKKKPSATFLGVRTGSGIDSALDDLTKVFYKRDASYDKAYAKLEKCIDDFKKLCADTKKKNPPKDADSKLYVEQLEVLGGVLDTILEALKDNRPQKA